MPFCCTENEEESVFWEQVRPFSQSPSCAVGCPFSCSTQTSSLRIPRASIVPSAATLTFNRNIPYTCLRSSGIRASSASGVTST